MECQGGNKKATSTNAYDDQKIVHGKL